MNQYSDYKDSGVSWIGEVPAHWGMKKPAYIFEQIGSGTTPPSSDESYYNGNINWLQTGDLTDGVIIKTSKKVTQKAVDQFSTLKIYPKGSLVIAMYGATIGKVGLLDIDTCTNQACCVLAYPNSVLVSFVYFWFLSAKQSIILMGYGGGQPNISQDTIRSLRLPIPPLPEQEAIVRYLDEKTALIDDLIRKKQEKIQLLQEKRTALINQVVTKGLDPDVEMKDSGVSWIGEVPAHWVTSRLKLVATVRSGFALNNSAKKENTLSYPYLRVANVQDGYLNLSTITEVEMDPESASRYFLQYGDLLMNEGGDNDKLGRGCVWRDEITPCLHQNHVFAVRMNPDVSAEWINLLTLTSYARQYFLLNCKQSTNLASISQSSIKELPVLMPPHFEQQQIINYLDEQTQLLDQTIRQEEQKIELLKEYRQSLISEVVTGKICVV